MNKKGFTLIELLAVIFVLALITTVTVTISIRVFHSYHDKTRTAFLARVVDVVENYLAFHDNLTYVDISSCLVKTDDKNSSLTKKVHLQKSTSRTFEGTESYFSKPFLNPANQKECSYTDSYFEIYKDEDMIKYVFLHLNCGGEILEYSTLPEVSDCA